ncbi:MAG TPA: hypothetical protein VF456_02570 [Vicinamibacterales bacterium]
MGAAAILVAGGVVATAAGVVGDGVVARGVVVAAGVVGGAVVVASAGVTGAVVAAGPAVDDGVGDASGGRDAATVAGGGALLLAGEDADFGSAPAGFAGAVVRAVRSGTGRLAATGRADELGGTREGVALADARGGVELDGVEVGRLFAVLPAVAVEGDDFAALAARFWFAVGRSLPAGVIVGAFTAFGGGEVSGARFRGGTVTSVTGPGGGTATSVTGPGGGTDTSFTALALLAAGFSSGAAACGETAAIR